MNTTPEKTEAVFRYVADTISRTGSSPSLRDIQVHFGYRSNCAPRHHVQKLIAFGWLRSDDKGRLSVVGRPHGRYQVLVDTARRACADTHNTGETMIYLTRALAALDDP